MSSRDKPVFFSLARFVERLTAAGRGVVRVLNGDLDELPFQVASGWLITPTLVVVLDFSVMAGRSDEKPTLYCDIGAGDQVPARLARLADGDDARRIALLRLDRALPETEPLTLELGTASPGMDVLLPHHTGGADGLQLSLAQVEKLDGRFLYYDINVVAGGNGAPLLAAANLGVLAMAAGRGMTSSVALPLSAVLDELRGVAEWSEIAERHGLADVAVAREPVPTPPPPPPTAPADALVGAALRWSFDPAELAEADREAVRPLVVDAAAPRWSLALDHRQRLLREAGSPDALRAARRAHPGTEPGAAVVDRILDGAPYDLDAEPLDALPRWLQAVRWFDGTVPGLPTPAQVDRTLQRRRVRGDLAAVAGPGFRGRTAELAALNGWFAEQRPGPMVLTGIGGIGKSALVARFAELLPASVPLFWLDFDRVDLAPDDAVSLLTELGAQAGAQLDGFTAPAPAPDSPEASVGAFAAALTAVAPGPALLVLDGFEIAQHAARHQEIWPVLEGLVAAAPALRLLVSGRAPVTDLRLGGRAAATLRLTGLDAQVADAWLAERGVTDAAVRRRVVTASRGIPLVLKMAMRLLDAGGSVDDLPAVLVEGYLYHRILDRVVDAELQPVVRDALQLRAVHADLLAAVLPDRIPPGVEPAELLERLSRELAVVESLDEPDAAGPGVLRMRPEVRSAVLRLLTAADPGRVDEVDRRAAAWLAARASDDPVDAAELVYHRLRTGDVAGAAAAWREGCAARLGTAPDDLFDPAARQWLLDRLNAGAVQLAAWERDAAERIRGANKRGLTRIVAGTLAEHGERSDDSPLLVHDAWVRWQAGDPTGAAGLLDAAPAAPEPIARDRALVRAGLAVAAGDRSTADRLLAGIADEALWPDPLSALAVQAARVRLTVDLAAELELAALTEGLWTAKTDGLLVAVIRSRVVPGDVVLPTLAENIAGFSTFPQLHIPERPDELPGFADAVQALRRRLRAQRPADPPEAAERVRDLAARLGELGERRWQLATSAPLLLELRDHAIARQTDWLQTAVAATLAAFRGLPLDLHRDLVGDVDTALGGTLLDVIRSRLTEPALARTIRQRQTRDLGTAALRTVLAYAWSPDPLTLLIRRALGLPDDDPGR